MTIEFGSGAAAGPEHFCALLEQRYRVTGELHWRTFRLLIQLVSSLGGTAVDGHLTQFGDDMPVTDEQIRAEGAPYRG